MNTKRKRIPKLTKLGLDEYFLVCRPSGKIEVKDGRTLEEYINDPRFIKQRIKQRKKEKCTDDIEMILYERKLAEWGIIPRTA